MDKIIAILIFGVLAIFALLAFALHKILRLGEKDNIFICRPPEHNGLCNLRHSCKLFCTINADFLERRNEFWQTLGQFITIIVIIILMVILLLLDKISSEAALPIIAGLGSFGIGKSITTTKNNSASNNEG